MKQPSTYYHCKESKARVQVHQGGTRSGKTYSICTALIEWACTHPNSKAVITIVRKTYPALRASVMRDFIEILQKENIYREENHNKSDSSYRLFGNLFEFVSIDAPQKIRGRKRTVCFINEANELTYEDWQQLILRTTDKMIIDFNPSDTFSWIYDYVLPRDDADFYQTTYKDNPYLGADTIAEIERLKDTDDNYWRIYGLGERGVNVSAIFPRWSVAPIPENAKLVAYGMDWGFTNDPTALVAIYQTGHELYFDELLYETGLTNQDIAERLKTIIGDKRTPIIADSAEPKSIEEIHRMGWNVKPSKKGPDSIRVGIDIMKRHKLHATKDSTNLHKELQNYQWETDRNNRQLNKPKDIHNHAIDAIRYVCINRIGTGYSGKYFIT